MLVVVSEEGGQFMDNRVALLQKKASELESWAKVQNLLQPGERIVVTIEIQSYPVVEAKVVESGKKKPRRWKALTEPVTEEDWQQILSFGWGEKARRCLEFARNSNGHVVDYRIVAVPHERINSVLGALPFRICKVGFCGGSEYHVVRVRFI
jgi:hypothetical protein